MSFIKSLFQKVISITLFLNVILLNSFAQKSFEVVLNEEPDSIITGAEQINIYLNWIKDKNVALVANQTSIVANSHLVDTLLKSGVKIEKVFCPEHGFRGEAEAGEKVGNFKDKKTGVQVVSLYGEKKKPSKDDLKGVDIVLFDIQDVGARFYTYISTMTLMMEACAELNIPLIILDRPNPNGHYIAGPTLEPQFSSFIGMHPIPIVHGMTMAEYAIMVNGEGWLKDKLKCNLKYVTVLNYDHKTLYTLPVKPSPNLPNMSAVYLYPTLCLFEGTDISIARGTELPFQAFGHPELKNTMFTFIPKSIPGMSLNPPHLNKECKGYDLRSFGNNYFYNHRDIYLFWLIECYKELGSKSNFFNSAFDKLAGTDKLRNQIIEGKTEDEIRKTWQDDLDAFMKIRKKYLLYPDFDN